VKTETKIERLNKLLGLTQVAEEIKVVEEQRRGRFQSIPEDQIQTFREAQGIIYFLQAPTLFQLKVCKHCDAEFLVSRLYVGLCSYTCIQNSLAEMGIKWSRAGILEDEEEMIHFINRIYDGNEPIWVRNLPALKAALQRLTEFQTETLSQIEASSQENSIFSPSQINGTS